MATGNLRDGVVSALQDGMFPVQRKDELKITTPKLNRYPCALAAGGCGEIGIHAGFRCLWALRPWRFESSQPHSLRPLLVWGAVVPAAIV